MFLRATGTFDSVERIRRDRPSAPVVAISGSATLPGSYRGYADPPSPRMNFNGQPAIGIGVVMAKGGDVIGLGEHLHEAVKRLGAELPAGH